MGAGKTSIIIPTFNCDSFIEETLRSVSAQTCVDWECLIIDDGSSDRTVEITQECIASDNRFKLFRREKISTQKGGNVCRNIGIKNAVGEFLIFLDGDDVLKPFCLEQRINYFNDHSECDFLVFQMSRFNELGEILNSESTKSSANYLYEYLAYNIPWSITAPIMKREFVIQHLTGFDEDFPRLQDPEFYTRALLVEDVKFKVFQGVPADCMYRQPIGKKWNMLIGIEGFSKYIVMASSLVKGRVDEEYCRQQLTKFYCTSFEQVLRNNNKPNELKVLKALTTYSRLMKRLGLLSNTDYIKRMIKSCCILGFKVRLSFFNKLIKVANFISICSAIFLNSFKSKVWFFFPFYHTGGGERVHLEIVRSVKKDKALVFFLQNSVNEHYLNEFKQSCRKCFNLSPFVGNQYLQRILFIVFSISSFFNKVTVFGCNNLFFYRLLPYLRTSTRKIDLVHAFSTLETTVERFSLPYVSLLHNRVTINERTREDFRQLYQTENIPTKYTDRIVKIENAIYVPDHLVKTNRVNDKKKLNIIFVGRVAQEKRVHLLVKAIRQLPFELDFSVFGPLFVNIEGINDFYKGNVIDDEELDEIYNEADILLMASEREGFPLVVMEAMARGVVCILTNVGGISEHVHPHKNGLLIEEENEDEIVEAIVQYISYLEENREVLFELAQNSFLYAVEYFNTKNFHHKYRELLKIEGRKDG
ncbi:glycosyltransferase [Sphingobacterium wenxiniae]|uniref:Glycosyltransferase involved in cell wall bisynthesis n=1 Tax=Sphingobacterium wenxiniae TaxID=683125 RepID=A0A1I6U861_9SPHI|nr:glycosyltransferase [Sphingobacterium wenxiniae]SFS97643.1 Glycosyltransferase involved in cell wall bisynthesis [Sphingobacterium wenxiniae]